MEKKQKTWKVVAYKYGDIMRKSAANEDIKKNCNVATMSKQIMNLYNW